MRVSGALVALSASLLVKAYNVAPRSLTTEYIDLGVCTTDTTVPPATKTIPVTATITDPGTTTITTTVSRYYTGGPYKRDYPYPPAHGKRELTIIESFTCDRWTTYSVTPTVTVTNPASTVTTHVAQATVSDISTYYLCAPGNICIG